MAAHCSFEPQQQHTADSGSDARFSLAYQQFLHYNSHSDLATLHPNHLGEPDTPCTVRFFEIRIPSFTVLMIPSSFAHHIPVDHHKILHLVHHAYSLALQLDATHMH